MLFFQSNENHKLVNGCLATDICSHKKLYVKKVEVHYNKQKKTDEKERLHKRRKNSQIQL